MSVMPTISVIVPVYKAEAFLQRCVDSLLNQSYKEHEIILVDDGSPDNCPQICDNYAPKDNRIKVIHQSNSGVSSARNSGLDKATGDYITFVDSDDFIESNTYEEMMAIASKYNADVVLADCIKDFPDHQEIYSHDIRSGFYNHTQLLEEYYPHLLMMENLEYPATISNCLMLCKRETVDNIRYPQGIRFSEDLLFGARVMQRAHSFYYMKGKAFYHYVMNPNSATHIYVSDKWNDYKRLYQELVIHFGNGNRYNFAKQISLCLIFFMLNTIGDIHSTDTLKHSEKIHKIKEILEDKHIQKSFSDIKLKGLKIFPKLKIELFLYKHRWLIPLLTRYHSR